MCAISDLEAFFDIQFPRIDKIVEQFIGVNREDARLKTKALLRIEHHFRTNHILITEGCRGKNVLIGGTRQRNVVSGSMFRDVLHLIFKEFEKERIDLIIKSTNNGHVEQSVVVVVVAHDTDYGTSGKECESKMQEVAS